MNNKEKLDNFLKIDIMENESLHKKYYSHIDTLIESYKVTMNLKKINGNSINTDILKNEFEFMKNELNKILNSEQEQELSEIYYIHISVVALEFLSNIYIK